MSGFVLSLALGTAVFAMVIRSRRRRSSAPRRAAEAGLDLTIDLLSVVMGSGGTVRQAIATVAATGPAAVRPAFAAVLERSAGGLLLADALVPLSSDLGAAFHPLAGALIATERDGAPVSMLLQRLADEAEQARRWQAEAMAKRLPVSLLVPLVVCLLPAVVIGAVVPLAVIALRQLGG